MLPSLSWFYSVQDLSPRNDIVHIFRVSLPTSDNSSTLAFFLVLLLLRSVFQAGVKVLCWIPKLLTKAAPPSVICGLPNLIHHAPSPTLSYLGCLLSLNYPDFTIITFVFHFYSAWKSLAPALRDSLPLEILVILTAQKGLSHHPTFSLSLSTHHSLASSPLHCLTKNSASFGQLAKSWLLLNIFVYDLSSQMETAQKILNCMLLTSVYPVPRVWIMGDPE